MTLAGMEASSPGMAEFVDDRSAAGVFRVRRSTMTSDAVLELERERIFARCWLYVGHESELGSPGEFCARNVGGQRVLMRRSTDGAIACVLDRCPVCGGSISAWAKGSGATLACPVHGQLAHDKSLCPVPRFDSYRGLHFASFDAGAEPLISYLGAATDYIDLVMDQSEVGMRVLAGSQEFGFRANWKLYIENSFDIYHALPVHQTYWHYVASRGGGVAYHGRSDNGRASALGTGHAVTELTASYARPIARWDPTFGDETKPVIEAVRARLVARFGEERAFRMADTIRLMVAFPNFVLDDISAITIRSINPVRPDYTVVQSWALAPVDEPDELLACRLKSYLSFIGPGGFATPDDVEAIESCQAGFGADGVEWSDISRGAHRSPSLANDELQMRTFWRGWASWISSP